MSKTESNLPMRDPAELRLHSLQKMLPEPDKQSPEWLSFVDAQSAAGPEGTPEIFITDDGRIMDGGRRWRAARQLGWNELAIRVRPEEDCAALIVESLLGQRNLLRGAKVYLALGMFSEFATSAEHRRLQNLKKGRKTLEKALSTQLTVTAKNPEGLRPLAEKFGCSHELVRQCVDLRKALDADADLKAFWEPKIFNSQNPVGIGAALAGIAGGGADQSGRGAGVERSQLEFWDKPFDGLLNAAPAWKKLGEDKREAVLIEWRKTAAKLPADLRAGMKEVLEELE